LIKKAWSLFYRDQENLTHGELTEYELRSVGAHLLRKLNPLSGSRILHKH
jgi:hypothetical protein